MDSVLRPRDIQARIRSGESPETVAAAAQTTVDKIMGFATPVLAERAYVAQQAQKASVRRRAGDSPMGHLGDAVANRLQADDIDPESVEWDAWRREDGRWTLVADFGPTAGARRAQFVYDAAGRYVVAEDEESRWLIGERDRREPVASGAAGAGADPEPALGGPVDAAQLPIGDDAIELVTGRRPPVPSPLSAAEEATVDLTDTAAAVRPSTPLAARGAQPTGSDWISTQASDRPADAASRESKPGAEQPATLFDAREVRPVQAHVKPAPATTGPADQVTEVPADEDDKLTEPAATPDAPKRAKAGRAKGRASVPSWDEIMFGSSRGE